MFAMLLDALLFILTHISLVQFCANSADADIE